MWVVEIDEDDRFVLFVKQCKLYNGGETVGGLYLDAVREFVAHTENMALDV